MDRLEGANEKNIWDFISWYSSGKQKHSLYTSLTQVPATSNNDHTRTCISQFFPPPPPVAPFTPLGANYHTRDWAPLMRKEVSKALKSCKDNLALGPSQVSYKAVKSWEAHPLALWYLYSHCFNLGHYPALFKTSITTVVKKPNKENYTDPSSFRPIQLIECPGKVLEKYSTKQIQFKVTNHDIVPGTQFGGHSHSSTLNASLSLSQDIHNAWGRGLKSTALMFNISRIFNFINYDILTQQLAGFGFNIKTTNLIKGFLTSHRTQISYNNYLSDPHNIPNSIPQRSSLSPILSILYSAPLLTIREHTLHRISTLAYVDDGVLLTLSSSLSISTTRLQNAYPFLEKALMDIGLSIQPKKLEIMHFTRGPDQENPPFHLPSLVQPITPPKSLHWLGFHLDCHRYFTHHTKLLAAKATRTVHAIHILGNLVKGMSHPQLRTLTLTTITPILMYRCQLWWGSRFSYSNTNCLQTDLNSSL